MQQPHKWIWGLIPVILLWVLASVFQTQPIEQDLSAKAAKAMSAQSIIAPAISVAGRDVTVSGTRLSGDSASLSKAIDAQNGVRLVRDNTDLAPEVYPYTWQASRDGSNVTLSGHVPSLDVRTKLLTAAKAAFPDARITDAMRYARGTFGDFDKLIGPALAPMAFITKGQADIVGGAVSVAGDTATGADYRAALAAAKTIPAAAISKVDIRPPVAKPYTFGAEKAPGAVVLTGFYPDEKTHTDILAQVKRLFLGAPVTDKMQEARGEPANFAKAVSIALSQLSRLDTGAASLIDQAYKLSGIALYEKAAEQINAAVKTGLPQGYVGVSDVSVKKVDKELDAATCQAMMTGLLGKGRILFETGGARIDGDSAGLLDALAFTARSCPTSRIEVSGHTDTDGDNAANLELSKRRAQAVVDYLANSGIATNRITAAGYGVTRPIASNDTEEGKALNRRIEFAIQ